MRLVLLLLCACGLAAGEGLRLVAVEREGLPPYEDDRRIYRLRGEGTPAPGELLQLSRRGVSGNPGRLRVLRVTPEGVLAVMDRRGDLFPLKGDVAAHFALQVMPDLPGSAAVERVEAPPAALSEPPRAPRHFQESIYFLPGDPTLSPLGRQKVQTRAREWGGGSWTLEVPAAQGRPARLQTNRQRAVLEALKASGVAGVRVRQAPAGAPHESVVLRFDEGAPPPPRKKGRRRG